MSQLTKEKREVRKLQVTGGSTFILSLPKEWIIKTGLKKGSHLNLEMQNNGYILLIPEGSEKTEKPSEAIIKISPNEAPDFVIREIVSAYLVGYNVIYLRAKNGRLDLAQRNTIKDFTRKMLVGTEIIADSPSEVLMKVLLSYPELSVQSVLRRMCIISASMHKDVIKALKELNRELAQEVIAMDDEVDRFSLYIIRQLKAAVEDEKIIKEIGLTARRDCLGYRLVTKAVERTADHAVEIAENVLMLKKPLEIELYEQIEAMSVSATTIFDEAMETLFKKDFQLANNIVQKAKQAASLRKELMKIILKRTDIGEVSSLSLIIESITRAVQYASDIAEIVLNMNVNQILIDRD